MLPLPEYDRWDALEMRDRIARGDVTPQELLAAAAARIEARDPAINAVVHLDLDRARRVADRQDGPFAGVPTLLKDLRAQDRGQPCTDATRLKRAHRPDFDSFLVERIKAAGLVILGRTNTPEFGIYPVTEPELFGPCRNPWNPERSPGGSSGGAAAAVAARLVPVAQGSDGGGSIRIPAGHCGVVGLKPTRARNPLGPPLLEGWGGMVCAHFLTRSVRDSAALLDAVSGPVPGAPYACPPPERPFLEELDRPPGRLRIAWTPDPLLAGSTHPACRAAVEATASLLEQMGHEVVEARPEIDREALVRAYFTAVAGGIANAVRAAAALAGRPPRASDFEPGTWILARIGEALTAAEYDEARTAWTTAGRALARFHERHDLLLTSTTAHPAPLVGELAPPGAVRRLAPAIGALPRAGLLKVLDNLSAEALGRTANTMLFNMTGAPAISLPVHHPGDADLGVPVGVQFAAPYAREDLLLRVAARLEEAVGWERRLPPAVEEALGEAPTELPGTGGAPGGQS